jgi:hypothetical protein
MSSSPQPLGQPWYLFFLVNHYISKSSNFGQKTSMKLRLTLMLTLSLFSMMLIAGGLSTYLGFLMGGEALKVVTQPDVNPENNSDNSKYLGGVYKGLKIVDEKDILVKVYNYVYTKENGTLPPVSSPPETQNSTGEPQTKNVPIKGNFPITNQNRGVIFAVSQAQMEGNSLLLNLDLKNESTEAVRFLYSFLDVRDDRGRPLSAIPEGLPGELPANSQNFNGTLRIPSALLDGVSNISLTLTDYPAQQLELKLEKIPVTLEQF